MKLKAAVSHQVGVTDESHIFIYCDVNISQSSFAAAAVFGQYSNPRVQDALDVILIQICTIAFTWNALFHM